MRKTSTPARRSFANISGELEAGPTVATVFVRESERGFKGVNCPLTVKSAKSVKKRALEARCLRIVKQSRTRAYRGEKSQILARGYSGSELLIVMVA